MTFAEFEFSLDVEQEDKATLREHLAAYEERTGRPHQTMLDAPPLPEGCRQLWRTWNDLRGSVSSGMGIGRISYAEMGAYQELTGHILAPWEVDAIRKVDRAFVIARSKK